MMRFAPVFLALMVALCVAFDDDEAATSQPASAPASAPAETFEAAVKRLNALKPKERTEADLALRAGVAFLVALGTNDAKAVTADLDAAGYQPLPATGELPEQPEKATTSTDVAKCAKDRIPRSAVASFPMDRVELLRQKDIKTRFPAVAKWMLPTDYVLVANTVESQANWLSKPACVVIRVRGSHPSVMGGTVIEALAK